MRSVIVALIKGYQFLVSPVFPQSCRFYPSCSEYTLQAVNRYGTVRGLWLGMKRLVRCNPFGPGGIDELE